MEQRCVGGWAAAAGLALLVGCGSSVTDTDASGPDVANVVDRGVPGDAQTDGGGADDDAPTIDATVDDDRGGAPFDRPDAAPGEVSLDDVPGALCASPTVVRDGDVLTGQAFGEPSRVPPCQSDRAGEASVRWYVATVPADGVLEVSLTGATGQTVSIYAFDSCEASSCLGRVYDPQYRGPLTFHNERSAPRQVLVAVANYERSPVTVAVRVRPAAPNATCPAATPLVDGVTLRDQDLGRATDGAATCAAPAGARQPALFYAMTVPAHSALSVRAVQSSSAPTQVTVDIRPPCGEAGCLPTASLLPRTESEARSVFVNAGDAPRPVTIAVTSPAFVARPVVDVTADLRTIPANARCAGRAALTPGVALRVEHPEDATDPTPRCPVASDAPPRSLYYDVTVPAGQTLTVTSGGSVRLFDGCGGLCLSAGSAGADGRRAVYANATGAPQRPVVAAAGDVPIELLATLRPTAANVTCAGAVALGPASPARNVDLLEAREPDPCVEGAGPVVYFTAEAPAGRTLVVEAGYGGEASASPVVSLSDACDGVCLAVGRPLSERAARVAFTNNGAARRLIVAVGRSAFGADDANLLNVDARVQ